MSQLRALSQEIAEVVGRVAASVVAVHGRQPIPSSGFVWQDGIVVTADHTLKQEDEITLTLADGSTAEATLVARDPSTDLAVLRTSASIPAVTVGAQVPAPGEIVLALGHTGEDGVSASFGILQATSGQWRSWRGGTIDRFVRADVSLYPGQSGGPLVDVSGHVVGLNTSGLARHLTVTVPVSTIGRVIQELLEKGRVARGYLGLGMQPICLPRQVKQALSLSQEGGVMVINVEAEGPAEKAGLFMGDVLLGIDGQSVCDTDDVLAVLAGKQPGDALPLTLLRAGQTTNVSVTIGERPRRE